MPGLSYVHHLCNVAQGQASIQTLRWQDRHASVYRKRTYVMTCTRSGRSVCCLYVSRTCGCCGASANTTHRDM